MHDNASVTTKEKQQKKQTNFRRPVLFFNTGLQACISTGLQASHVVLGSSLATAGILLEAPG